MNYQISDEALLHELDTRFRQNKKMLEELQLITAELKTANAKLEESEALKSHFISNITNEIQNPFTSIIGLAKNILSVKKEDWKTVITMVSHIYSEAFNLDFQLKNIFMAAKIEAGELSVDVCKVDIKSLLESVQDAFKFECKKKKIAIQLTIQDIEDVWFKTDPEKLRIVINNLMSNAIKYSKNGGEIIISAIIKNNSLIVSIQDFGEGISENNKKVIFDRFKRLDSGINSINRGHGLGLSINKALIDLLDGTITIDSEVKKGSKFTFMIPENDSNVSDFSVDDNQLFFENDENDNSETF